jgi:hypothetical protein
LCWQITPKRLGELMNDLDTAKAKRVAEAMLKMVKFDIAELEAAAKDVSSRVGRVPPCWHSIRHEHVAGDN